MLVSNNILLDLCEFPAIDLDIQRNRRRGRPRKAAKALETGERAILPEIDLNIHDKENSAPTTSKRKVTDNNVSKKNPNKSVTRSPSETH